ncbi:MAG: hypothetical protein HYT88_03620 [Candidatus Omnitrophica bacterium]|nr:hypothetical protein [Candidatus Omnitrophota bacterium]MBI2174481.1 hypothetical protein [Candidatus Omnitrophota bacterium]
MIDDDMLSEEERREMLEMAKSTKIREEFRILKAASRRSLNVDQLMSFLTGMSELNPTLVQRTRFVAYPRALL